MAKFYGEIGYSMTIKTSSGIWEETIEKKNYFGDVVRNSRSWQNSSNINDNLELSNQISYQVNRKWVAAFRLHFNEWNK